ncbi:MAG: PH domain-containing protein [Akkermansiaceae bacterium]|nr:PH domain-containing protein [Akkermansiaceae bacterium]
MAANLSWYVALGTAGAALVAGWNYLVVRCQRYEVTTQRLRLVEGVLNQRIDEVELYRVKDTQILRPVLLRVFGLGNLQLETSDRTHPKPVLAAIKNATEVREQLRKHVETLRDQKRVREVDFDETGDSEFGDELG